MAKKSEFPLWVRGRAQRHIDRGCNPRVVGIIVRGGGNRASDPAATEMPMALPPNVILFRAPAAALRQPFPDVLGDPAPHHP